MSEANVLAVVTARGGSKGLPGKNILPFLGKPLISWSIESSLEAKLVNRVIVTTDSEEIAAIARASGAEVPFLRPSMLAQDETPDLPVFDHVLDWLDREEGYRPSILVHMRPTTPLRPAGLIDEGLRRLIADSHADSIRAVCRPHNNPFKMWRIAGDGAMQPLIDVGITEPYNQPRQVLPAAYWQTGTFDACRTSCILEKRSMTGDRILALEIDPQLAVDIDDEFSFMLAELAVQRFQNEPSCA